MNIDFNLSGSDLTTQHIEDAAIKHHFPIYNRVTKRILKPYAIFSYEDREGNIHFAFNPFKDRHSEQITKPDN